MDRLWIRGLLASDRGDERVLVKDETPDEDVSME